MATALDLITRAMRLAGIVAGGTMGKPVFFNHHHLLVGIFEYKKSRRNARDTRANNCYVCLDVAFERLWRTRTIKLVEPG